MEARIQTGLLKFVLLIFLIAYVSPTPNNLPFNVRLPNKIIDKDDIETWVKSHDLGLILFCNEVTLAGNPEEVVARFETVGARLNDFGIHFGVYDCRQNPTHERCIPDQPRAVVAAYLKGMYMLDLPADALYDASSILSNSLQLLLINEMLLIQTSDELIDHMKLSVTKSVDFLLLFVKGIGTKEHAQYMELARNILDTDGIDISFAHSTTHSLMSVFNSSSSGVAEQLGLGDAEAHLYYVQCSSVELSKDVRCPIYQYTGRFDSSSLSQYLSILTFAGQKENALSLKLPTSSCFYGNDQEKTRVLELIDQLTEEIKGEMLFYSLPSSELNADETKLYQEIGALCTIKDENLGLEAIIGLDSVPKYIVWNILAKRRKITTEEVVDAAADLSDVDALIQAVETVDDSVDKLDDELGGVGNLDLSHLVKLDRKSFKYKSFTGVVLFHIKRYDHRNRLVLRLYNEAAANLPEGTLSIIDCYGWTDVCKKVNVTEFPTIRLYKKGKYQTYSGPLSTPAFTNMAFISEFDCPLQVSSMTEVLKLREQLKKSRVTQIVIGLFEDVKAKECKAFTETTNNLAGQYLSIIATGELADRVKVQFELQSLPVIAMYNISEKDMSKAVVKFDRKSFTAKTIQHFVMRSALPSFVELSPLTLPLVQISRRPQVLFFTKELKSETFDTVQTLSADQNLKTKFGFNYLPLKDNSLNQRILRTLTESDKSPALLVCDYTKGKVFNYNSVEKASYTSKDMKSWLQQLSVGNIAATSDLAEGEWKAAHPGYDFLELVEQDKKKKRAEHDRLNILPKEEQDMATSTTLSPNEEKGVDTSDNGASATARPSQSTPPKHTEL